MVASHSESAGRRITLNRERVLQTAVALADVGGIDDLSMRRLAQELGVVPMALYKHVAHKDELLDGMIEMVVGEIDAQEGDNAWKAAVRQRIMSARTAMLRHPWARRVLESRVTPTPTVLAYMDSMIGLLRAGGLSLDLTHHVMHALGSRLFGFSQDLFTQDGPGRLEPDVQAAMLAQLAHVFPNVAAVAAIAAHEDASVVGAGCDDRFEFEFTLDLLLDGIELLHQRGWSSGHATHTPPTAVR